MRVAAALALLLTASTALAGCQDGDSAGGASGVATSGETSPGTEPPAAPTYRFVVVEAHVWTNPSVPAPSPPGCGEALETATWRSAEQGVWVDEEKLSALGARRAALVVLHVVRVEPGTDCRPRFGVAASDGGAALVDWWPGHGPPLTLTPTASGVHIDGNVDVPNGHDRDVEDGGGALYDTSFRAPGADGGLHDYGGVIWVTNRGGWPREGLHVEESEGSGWTSCCPPGVAQDGEYWVLEIDGRLERDPPYGGQPACGATGRPYVGVDAANSTLELPEGTVSDLDFSNGQRPVVLWSHVDYASLYCLGGGTVWQAGANMSRADLGLYDGGQRPLGLARDGSGTGFLLDGSPLREDEPRAIHIDQASGPSGSRTVGDVTVTLRGAWRQDQIVVLLGKEPPAHPGGEWAGRRPGAG